MSDQHDQTATSARRSNERASVVVTASHGQSVESLEADADRSMAFVSDLADRGVQSWQSRYRWSGPIKWMVAKEVGPPPWPWPKVLIQPSWSSRCIALGVGWRSTAYELFVMWAPRANGRSEGDDDAR